jgi:amino acid adenylation domain-containing protein
MTSSDTDIAIIGCAGRFPGARDVRAFWRDLCDGKEQVRPLSDDVLRASGVAPERVAHPAYVKYEPSFEGYDLFDAAFFGYGPREATIIDPQQRLFLEACWEALEDAGYDPERLEALVGIFATAGASAYLSEYLWPRRHALASFDPLEVGLANGLSSLPARVSYKLNLKGPSVAVQTACSSSLVAVHLAVQSLLAAESDLALAGGVFLKLPANRGYTYRVDSLLSPDGHCRPFDAQARGTIFGSGVGVVVLKRLSDALSDRDTVRAVIKGTAVTNDGARKAGFSAPSQKGQAEVVVEALAVAGVDPRSVSYVEAHGTGTALGDPIEVAALTEAFGVRPGHTCAIGSVKGNIGHLDAAAGVAGLIKTVLALEHRLLPATINLSRPNPDVGFERGPFRPNTALRAWEATGTPLRAGVSSFGLGGTNCHAIVEEAPPTPPGGPSRPWVVLPLSAKSPTALSAAAARLADYLDETPQADLADVAYTYQVGRAQFAFRRAVVGSTRADVLRQLREPVDGGVFAVTAPPHVRFAFPRASAPFHALARRLYVEAPEFSRGLAECALVLGPQRGVALSALQADRCAEGHDVDAEQAQAVLFAFEYALAQLWIGWGIAPGSTSGDGLGQYVAAAISGRLPLAAAFASALAPTAPLPGPDPDGDATLVLEMGDARPRTSGTRVPVIGVSDDDLAGGHVYRVLARLWTAGGNIAWQRFASTEQRRRVPVPTYPFERQRFWLDVPAHESHAQASQEQARVPEPAARATSHAAAGVEAVITDLFQHLLLVERVGRDESFLERGGDSLAATQLASRLRDKFGVTIPLRTILETPTIAALTEIVAAVHGGAAVRGDAAALPPIPRVPREARMPLSSSQQRLWFLDALTPGTPIYNVSTGVELRGELDEEALEAALQQVVERHEVLRAAFLLEDGQPVQVVQPDVKLLLERHDLQTLPAREQQRALHDQARDEARRPFDLTHPPLLRAKLMRLAPRHAVVVLTLHHIIADGWSLGVLVHELVEFYRACRAGCQAALDELPIQYADYAQWQREALQGEVLESLRHYWHGKLGGELPVLALPTDTPRPALQTHRGERQPVHVAADTVRALHVLAASRQMTLYMVLLAALATLLRRHSGQDEILIGSPVANRRRSELERLLGCFVNVLAMRIDVGGNPTFGELLRRVREVAVDAYAHQDMPFERLVEELKLPRDLSHPPIVQVLFVLQNTPRSRAQVGGLSLAPFQVDPEVAAYDLTLSLEEVDGALVGSLEYNADLFEPVAVRRLIGHFQTLLERLAVAPEHRIDEVSFLPEAERRTLICGTGPTVDEPPRCFQLAVQAHALARPHAIAVQHDQHALSYGTLERRANQLARHLQRLGAGPDAVVGLCLERSLDAIVTLIAILKSGAAYLPLDPAYPPERLAYLVNDSGARLIVTHAAAAARLPSSSAAVVDLAAVWPDVQREHETPPAAAASLDALAYVIYTSGSTGQPKGTMVPQRGLESVIRRAQQEYVVTVDDRVLLSFSLSFDASVLVLAMALGLGAQLVIVDAPNLLPTQGFVHMLRRLQITHLAIFPSALALLDDDGLPALRTLIVGGEPCPHALIQRWRHGRRMLNSYGACETTIWCTSGEFDDAPRVSIGRPLPGVSAYILDRFLNPVPAGVAGELYVTSTGLARGYLHRPAETAEFFVPDCFAVQPGQRMYRTGDRGRWWTDGRIELLGRVDEQQVKVQGVRIELREVEAALLEHPTVKEAVVAAAGSEAARALVAYVVTAPEERVEAAQLRSFLAERLPGYMVPSIFMRLGSLPLLPGGKVDYRALPAPDRGSKVLRQAYTAPESERERAVAAIAETLLNVDPIGRDESLFELGAHSLLMVQLKARLDAAFQCDLPLADLFRHPTVAAIARYTQEDRPAEHVVAAGQARAALRSELSQRRALRRPSVPQPRPG